SLNVWLVTQAVAGWVAAAGSYRPFVILLLAVAGTLLAALVLWISFEPLLARWGVRFGRAPITLPATAAAAAEAPAYHRILVPLDHTALDRQAIAHAAAMARMHHAKLYLLHVEEGVTSQVYGSLSSTAEVEAGGRYLSDLLVGLEKQGIETETITRYSNRPREEIVSVANEIRPDLVVMGAHGHKGLKDI